MERMTAMSEFLRLEQVLDDGIYEEKDAAAAVVTLLRFVQDHPVLHDIRSVRIAVRQQMNYLSCARVSPEGLDLQALEEVAE